MPEKKENCKFCDERSSNKNRKTFLHGIFYGLIPHIGCIAFIIASILGATILTEFFKPFLMNQYFFHALVAISFILATVSSLFYLKKQGLIEFERKNDGPEITFSKGILRRKWKYLSTMYGTTIFINLFLFLVIFPVLANMNSGPVVNNPVNSSITLQVDIPCSGHATLISDELKKLDGVQNVKFRFPNFFDVTYDPSVTTKDQILSLQVFEVYKPTVLDAADNKENVNLSDAKISQNNVKTGCCGNCGEVCGCNS